MKNFLKYYLALSVGRLSMKPKSTVNILCYHSVNNIVHQDLQNITVSNFEEQLKFLIEGYDVIYVDDLIAMLENDEDCSNKVAITFDDGYLDNYVHVFPLIKNYEIPITIYLATGFVEKKYSFFKDKEFGPLGYEQITEMKKSGLVRFGAHTVTHCNLGDLSDHHALQEIQKSLADVSAYKDVAVRSFALPNGQLNNLPNFIFLKRYLPDLVYLSTFHTTNFGVLQKYGVYPRLMIWGDDNVETLRLKLRGFYNFLHTFQLIRIYLAEKLLRLKSKQK